MSERRVFMEAFPETFEGTKVRVQLFPLGKFNHPEYGEFEITKELLTKAKENFEATKRALAVDFDHGLQYGKTPEQRRAAGWIRELAVTDSGMFADFDATEEAAAWIKGGQYRFISPTYVDDFKNKETGTDQGFTIVHAGLTNTPWFDGMAPCVAMNERTEQAVTSCMTEIHEIITKMMTDKGLIKKAVEEKLKPRMVPLQVLSERERIQAEREAGAKDALMGFVGK